MFSDALQTATTASVLNAVSVAVFMALAAPLARRCSIAPLAALCAFVAADTFILSAPLLLHWRIGHWNWIGKLASIAFSLVVMQACLGRMEIGWRLPATRQAIA